LWYPGSHIKTKTIKGHTAPVLSLDFSLMEEMILSGCMDKTIKLWDIDTLKFKSSFVGHTNWVNSAKLSNDMNLICSGGEDKKSDNLGSTQKEVNTKILNILACNYKNTYSILKNHG
jgi:WD40 repeat protein